MNVLCNTKAPLLKIIFCFLFFSSCINNAQNTTNKKKADETKNIIGTYMCFTNKLDIKLINDTIKFELSIGSEDCEMGSITGALVNENNSAIYTSKGKLDMGGYTSDGNISISINKNEAIVTSEITDLGNACFIEGTYKKN